MDELLLKEYNKNKALIQSLELRNREIYRVLGLDEKYKKQKEDENFAHRMIKHLQGDIKPVDFDIKRLF